MHAENVWVASKTSRSASLFELHEGREAETSDATPKDLKRKTALGALLSMGAQVGTFVLRVGSFMIPARLLLKEDFGLLNMVTAVTGFLGSSGMACRWPLFNVFPLREPRPRPSSGSMSSLAVCLRS